MLSALPRNSALALGICLATWAPKAVAQIAAPWGQSVSESTVEAVIAEHMKQAQQAISQVSSAEGAETVTNTLVPYDDALRHIDDAIDLARLIAHTSPAGFKNDAEARLDEVLAARDAQRLNQRLYRALTHLDVSNADATTRHYVQQEILRLQLAGAEKDDGARKRLLELYARLAADRSAFEHNVASDPRYLTVMDPADLDGLPPDFVNVLRADADGRVRIPADETTLPVVMRYAENPDFRVRFSNAYYDRAFPQNRKVLQDMLEAKYQIARLLNFDSWVDLSAHDSMIGSVRSIDIFLNGIDTGDRPVVDAEWAMLLEEKRREDPTANDLYAYEFPRLAMLIRKRQFDLDEASVREYFPFRLVQQRVLRSMGALFRVEFHAVKDAAVWAPAVEAWDVFDAGNPIGRIYLDMHPRPGKFTGNEMLPVVEGVKGKQLPQAALLCNFPMPADDSPGLMEYDEVVAFVHQMAHALHHIFAGSQSWAGASGIPSQTDFAEVPALMLEDWVRNPQVLASLSGHYKTGAPLSSEQISRVNSAFTFGRAIEGVALPAALAYIANDLHRSNPKGFDLNRMTLYDLRQYGRLMPLVAEGRMFASMYSLAEYSSEGYSHLWDKVIAEDFYQQFVRENLLEGDAGPQFRAAVLAPGGSKSANELVKGYLGRSQDLTAFRSWMGAEFHELPDHPRQAY